MAVSQTKKNEFIVLAFDAPDPDNPAGIIHSIKKFRKSHGLENMAILLTGRPVGPPWDEKGRPIPGQINEEESQRIHQLNMRRIYAYLRREGLESVHVYDGGIAAETSIPDKIHYKEEKFNDIGEDGRPEDRMRPLSDLVEKIGGKDVLWLAGGPLTGAALALYNYEHLVKQTKLFCPMLGDMGTADLMSGEQFNFLADRKAARFVLTTLDQANKEIVLITTDTTKHGLDKNDPSKQATLEMNDATYDYIFSGSRSGKMMRHIQREWDEGVLKPTGQREFAHDVAVGMVAAQVAGIGPQVFSLASTQCVFFPSEGKLRLAVEPPQELAQTMGREGPIRIRSGGSLEGERVNVKVALVHSETRETYIEDWRKTMQS